MSVTKTLDWLSSDESRELLRSGDVEYALASYRTRHGSIGDSSSDLMYTSLGVLLRLPLRRRYCSVPSDGGRNAGGHDSVPKLPPVKASESVYGIAKELPGPDMVSSCTAVGLTMRLDARFSVLRGIADCCGIVI